MSRSPIFIVGTERSGSNLLRLILNAHSRIAVPHPPHIMRYFAPIEDGYGDLSSDAAFGALVDDILRLVRVHIYPWDIAIERESIVASAQPRNTLGVFAALYDQFLAHSGKDRWACKSTFFIDHTDAVLARFPSARIILLTRDPRDVAVSSRQSVFSPFHPYFTAELWTRQQQTGLRLREQLPAQTLLVTRYEDLVREPGATVRQVCEFLDEPFEERMLEFFATDEAQKSGSLSESWRNTARPILTNRIGRFRAELSDDEVAVIEAVAGDTMKAFGYTCCAREQPPPSTAARARFHLLNSWWRARVELRSLRRDKNHWRRWSRDLWVTYLKVRRGSAHGA